MKNASPVRALNAEGSAASTGSTSKKRPNTAFMASSEVAIPPLVRRKSRRLEPEPRGQARRVGEDAVLDPALRGGLRQGRELLVGDEPGRQGQLGRQALAHVGADVEGVGVPVRHGGR